MEIWRNSCPGFLTVSPPSLGGTHQASSFSSSEKGSNLCAVFPPRETHQTQAQGLLGAGHGGTLPSKQQHPRRPEGKPALSKNVVLPEAGLGCCPNQLGEGARSQEPSSQMLPERQPCEQALLKIASSGLL